MEFTAQQIADFLKGSVVGDPATKVNNFSRIEEGLPGTITFLANPKYEHFIYETKASIVLVNRDYTPSSTIEPTLIKVANAYASLAMLLNLVEQTKSRKHGIDPSAFIAETASTGENCYIGTFAYIGENTVTGNNCLIYPHAYIGDNVRIGDNTIVYPHVTVYEGCIIGSNCIIHAGAVIGADGFGFAPEDGEFKKIAQIGNVILEDNVEIGANTTVDRAVMGSTIIHQGVKLDNLIQIAHNVEIGKNTVMASQVGIAGSTKIGANCMLGGQVGISGHLTIGDNAQFGAQSGIISNIKANARLMGTPPIPLRNYMRSSIIFEKLPEIYRTLDRLQKEVEELKKNKQ
ncbi:MAG: UDP-3-O-(3-hydroxymyristoyl)glucosamine N-acyltransferase [Tannerella sp.]|jgi:UDP-3-O-[3-hydroxymyristoyl] glucosamine N-acyltransferase|nr:UDP-3-O-(3-hydroxymyristoyl)glucosamine N-acyltransferase [Tannerella sp.]